MKISSLIPAALATCAAAAVAACDTSLDPAAAASETRAGAYASVGDDGAGNAVGKKTYRITVDGLEREAIVYVPLGARGRNPVPVVFMLHGTSGDGERFYNISGWREKADEEGFIAVFPTALTHCYKQDENRDGDFDDAGELEVTTKWAGGKLGDPELMPLCTRAELMTLSPARRARADHPLADDLAFFDTMADLLDAHYAVDLDRLYVSGFSNGAEMTSRLALERHDRFAAFAASGGTLSLEPELASRPVAMVLSLGELDDRFTEPYGVDAFIVGEAFFDGFPGRAFANRTIADYLELCGLTTDYTYRERRVGGKTIADFQFVTPVDGGAAGSELHFALIEGLKHQYPNGRNHPLRIADPLWAFFETKSLD